MVRLIYSVNGNYFHRAHNISRIFSLKGDITPTEGQQNLRETISSIQNPIGTSKWLFIFSIRKLNLLSTIIERQLRIFPCIFSLSIRWSPFKRESPCDNKCNFRRLPKKSISDYITHLKRITTDQMVRQFQD